VVSVSEWADKDKVRYVSMYRSPWQLLYERVKRQRSGIERNVFKANEIRNKDNQSYNTPQQLIDDEAKIKAFNNKYGGTQ